MSTDAIHFTHPPYPQGGVTLANFSIGSLTFARKVAIQEDTTAAIAVLPNIFGPQYVRVRHVLFLLLLKRAQIHINHDVWAQNFLISRGIVNC